MARRVRDIDRGMRAAVRRVLRASRASVSIGVHGDSPSYVRGQSEPATGPQVAAFQEFGTLDMYGVSEPTRGRAGVPQRSYIRSTVDENLGLYRRIEANAVGRIVDGTMEPKRAMGLIGEKVKADIQRKIVELDDPPNTEATIEAKGSSNPLIDTGQLRQSIQYKVRGA